MCLHVVHKTEGVLDCELVRGDRFKDVDKKRGKIIENSPTEWLPERRFLL